MEKRSALVAFLCGSVCHAFNVGNVVANHQGASGVRIETVFFIFMKKITIHKVFSPYLAMQ